MQLRWHSSQLRSSRPSWSQDVRPPQLTTSFICMWALAGRIPINSVPVIF
jgi:hypothetical protein